MNQRQTPALKRTPWYRGAALQITMALIAAGAVTWAGVISVWPSSSAVIRAKYRSQPTAIEVEAALGHLGLTPKVMAAANLSAEQTGEFASSAAGYVRERIATYRAAKDAVHAAHSNTKRLRRFIQGSAANQQQLTEYATAQSALETAQSQQQGVLTGALEAASGEISPAAMALLNTIRANKIKWSSIPERYLGDNRSESQWLALRDAVANERISAQLEIEPDPAAQQVLAEAQATLNASAAQTNMTNLAEIQAAWMAAMGQ